jgi:hypothetical protein
MTHFKVEAPNPGSWEVNDNFREVMEDFDIDIKKNEFIDERTVSLLKQLHNVKEFVEVK